MRSLEEFDTIASSEELIREIACDFLAIVACLQYYFDVDILSDTVKPLGLGTLKSVASVVMISVRAVIAMSTVSMIRQDAFRVRDSIAAPDHYAFHAEQQMRQRVVQGTGRLVLDRLPLTRFARLFRKVSGEEFSEDVSAYFISLLSVVGHAGADCRLVKDPAHAAQMSERFAAMIGSSVARRGIAPDDEAGAAYALLELLPI